MDALKTLIVYGTRKGMTMETVSVIAGILRDRFSHIVDISDSNKVRYYKKRINEYDNIIIGSSIVSGRWKSRILSFAKRDIFNNKYVAIFVTAGGTPNIVDKYGIPKESAISEAIENYIEKYSKKFKFDPISKGAFGGRVIKRRVEKYNSWNKQDIIDWTFNLGEKFKRQR
jgi:menaquinone-dependent protoporphyrinogen IX oxidase